MHRNFPRDDRWRGGRSSGFFPRWGRWLLPLMLAALGGTPALRALDPASDEALAHLADLIAPKRTITAEENQSRPRQIVYWLWIACGRDLSPESALTLAARRAGCSLTSETRAQLLSDWRVAHDYGLLTAGNLDFLREGIPPVATEGRYAGRRIETVAIREGIPASDLGNLALAPAGILLPAEALPRQSDQAALPSYIPVVSGPPPRVRPTATPATRTASSGVPDRSKPSWNPVNAPSRGRDHVQMPLMQAEVPTASTSVTGTRADSPGGDQVECHDMLPNAALSLGGQRGLAVVSVLGDAISVSIIGDGPKVHRESPGYYGTPAFSKDYPRISNSKVPKINPVRLPNVSGNSYLIHTDAQVRYYYVDVVVNNGSAFRIAKVSPGR